MKNLFLTFILLVLTFQSHAFRVTPMTAEFDAKGRGATQSFQVDNNGDKEVALEVEALTRKIDVEGKESREKTKDFMIYPIQLTVKPGEKKNIRVSYVGPEVEQELAFRLVVRQLPVNLEKKRDGNGVQSQINFLFEYVASLYIKGKNNFAPKIEVLEIKREGQKLQLKIKNAGGQHSLLKNFGMTLSDEKEKVEFNLSSKEFEALGGINLLVGDTRGLSLDIPAQIKGNHLKVDFKLRELN